MNPLDFDLSLAQDNGATAAAEALFRIRQKRESKVISESKFDDISRTKSKRDLMEEFTDEEMDRKLRTDSFFYEELTSKVTDEELAKEAISEMVVSQINFYKVLNVAPVLGHFSEHELLQNSEKTNCNKASAIIESFLRTNLYALDSETKKNKYKEKVLPLAESYLHDYNSTPTDSIDLAYKTVVIDNLLKYIQCSVFVDLYYEDCLTSDYYADFFDVEVLKESKALYDETVHTVAQIIATNI